MTEKTLFRTAFQVRFQFKQTFVAGLQNFAHSDSGEASLDDAWALRMALSDGRMTITLGPVPGDCERFLPQDLLPYLFFRGRIYCHISFITRLKDYSSVVAVGLLNFSVFLDFTLGRLSSPNCSVRVHIRALYCGLAISTMLPDMITNYNL